jgi:hypothetical protein
MSTLSSNMIELPSITDADAWEDPIPFDEVETPDIPSQVLPEPFASFASSLANETETAESLSVMTILGVLSSVLAKRFTVSPREGWNEPINIYTLIALPPANNKSHVLKRCTEPLIQWEKEQATSMEYEIKRCQSQRKTEEKIIEGLRKKAASIDDPLTQRALVEQISEKEANLTEVPAFPQLFANDTTPEALVTSVHEQNGRFSIFSDEGGVLETLAGLYNNGNSNIDILLKGIDGGELRVRRKDRSFNLNPYLTIVLAVQPAIIQTISERRSYMGNGALERFLYVMPKSKLGYRSHNNPSTSRHLIDDYNKRINSLLTTHNNDEKPCQLTLSAEALKLWRDFQRQIESELRPDGKLAPCQGWGGKICGFTLRLAGLLHVSQHETTSLTINDDAMDKAVFIAELLVDHAVAAYGLMGCDQAIQDAKEVFYWITSINKPSFTKTEILLAFRNKKAGKADRLNKALEILTNRNMLSDPIALPTKKPTITHHINPAILGQPNK